MRGLGWLWDSSVARREVQSIQAHTWGLSVSSLTLLQPNSLAQAPSPALGISSNFPQGSRGTNHCSGSPTLTARLLVQINHIPSPTRANSGFALSQLKPVFRGKKQQAVESRSEFMSPAEQHPLGHPKSNMCAREQ